jgi:hypothetical protein
MASHLTRILVTFLFLQLLPEALFAQDSALALTDAEPGQVVQLANLPELSQIPAIPLKIEPAGKTRLILSDKPEYFRTGNGISLREDVPPGVCRLYLYHVPEPTGEKRTISATIGNLSDQPMTLRTLRRSFPKPGGDYHAIGKAGLIGYWSAGSDTPPRTINPGQTVVLDEELDRVVVTKDILVHLILEFEVDRPARITVFQRDPDADSIVAARDLPLLPRVLPGWHPSGAGRGQFEQADRVAAPADGSAIDVAAGARRIVIADGDTDPWLRGVDSISPDEESLNKGNYGVMYDLSIPVLHDGVNDLAIVMVHQRNDSQWCKYVAAAVRVGESPIPLPRDSVRFSGFPEAVMVLKLPSKAAGTVETATWTYSPPGASCLPTPFLVLPVPKRN